MIKLQRKEPSFIIGLYIIIVIINLNAFGPFYDFQTIVLFGLIPVLSLIALKSDIYSFHYNNSEFVLYSIIFILMFTTIFYDIDHEMFIKNFNGMIGGLVASYIPIGLNKNKNYEDFFHIGFILSIIALLYLEYLLGNFNLMGFASIKGSRSRFAFNANYYSYISYFANFSLFYLYLKYRNLGITLLLIILPVFLIILSFITQSRSGLLFIIILNSFFWFYVVKIKSKNELAKFAKIVILIIAAIFLASLFLDTYQNSLIKKRVSKTTEDARGRLAKEGLEIFMNNPFLGVGLGQAPRYTNSGQFTHNSYTEILAEHGIFGGVLLLILFGLPTIKSFKKLRENRFDSGNKLNFLFFSTFLLYNNAYVFYKFSYAMLYFFLIISIQNKTNELEN